MTLSMVPKSQWSWEFSSEAHTGEVQFLFVDYKRRKALLRWEEGHWVPPGIIDVLYVRNFAEDLRKSLKLKACLWPSHVAWSMRKMCTCVRANGRITTGDLEKIVMVVACCEEKPQVVLGYDWHSLEDKEVFHLFDHAAMRIKEEIEMVVSGIYPEKRMYWERPGWLQEVLKLVETTTDSQVLKRVSIHRSSSAGAVVEVCTSKGIFFVKSSPGSRNDAVRSEAMARIAPKYCPMPVHVDRERRIMVMRDYGKAVSLWAKRDTETICAVYGTLALVQQETIGRTDELLEAGFMDTRPEALIHRFEDVVSHPELGFVENFCRNHAEKFETSDDLLEELTLHAGIRRRGS